MRDNLGIIFLILYQNIDLDTSLELPQQDDYNECFYGKKGTFSALLQGIEY